MMMRLRSSLFSLGYAGLTFIVAVVVMAVFWALAPQTRSWFYGLWCRLVVGLATLTCGIRYEVEGEENVPDDQPVVVISNHQSTWETIFLYQLFAPVVPILKKELLRIPFWGWALRLQKPIAIDRSRPREAMKSLLKQGQERIASGMSVLVFPEGTRSRPGHIGRFSRGGAQLAASSGAGVVPVIHDAGKCWPAGSMLKKPGTVRVIIGPAIPSVGRSAREIAAECDEWFDKHLPELGLEHSK